MKWIIRQIRKKSWSPYAAGVLLGITAILAVWLGNHLVAASGAIAMITSSALNVVIPDPDVQPMYFKFVMPPGWSWEIVLLIGIFFGGMLGALSSRTLKIRWNDDAKWKKVIGPQPWKRFVLGFLGAMIIQYGAGLAGGCTSGLAIAGGMLLAPSAFIFIACMFVSGIITALLVYGRRY